MTWKQYLSHYCDDTRADEVSDDQHAHRCGLWCKSISIAIVNLPALIEVSLE